MSETGATALSLAVRDVSLSYRRGAFTLDVPELDVAEGSTLALLGPSGSGKSSLLAVLGLLERPDAGRVLLGGREVSHRDRDARLAMAAVFQRPYLLKATVGANVAYGLGLRGVPAAARRSRVAEVLERVGLAGWENRAALTLSGGEAHRVSLARALVLRPRVLLLDEPLASLDPLLKRRLTQEFASILRAEAITTVYVTHDHDEALVVADAIGVMREGRIVAHGAAHEVTRVPADEWTAMFLGVEPPLPGVVVESEAGLVSVRCDGVVVYAVGDAEPGDRVALGIMPEDVMLVVGDAEMPLSSARNVLNAVVESLAPRGRTWQVVVRASGVRFASSISGAALDELGLAVGAPVTAVFKATAVRLRHLADVASDTRRGIDSIGRKGRT